MFDYSGFIVFLNVKHVIHHLMGRCV